MGSIWMSFLRGREKRFLLKSLMVRILAFPGYVFKYGGIAAMCRDPYVDGRREYTMAARLKSLAGRHKRILFTCGLAHWEMIQKLMKDPDIRPAEILIPEGSFNFTRVIIHPRMAVTFMDIYPVLTTLYEQNRHNPLNKSKDPGIFLKQAAYARIFLKRFAINISENTKLVLKKTKLIIISREYLILRGLCQTCRS